MLLLVDANLCNLPFFANNFVCTVSDPLVLALLKIDINPLYAMMHV